jgi:hypothetical protein
MGSPVTEPERRAVESQVDVTLTRGLLDRQVRHHPRTVAQRHGEMPRPSRGGAGDDFPVYSMNHFEARPSASA